MRESPEQPRNRLRPYSGALFGQKATCFMLLILRYALLAASFLALTPRDSYRDRETRYAYEV